MRKRMVWKVGRVIALIAVVALALGFIIMQLWNGLVPELFGGPVIGYWQAIGLLLLSRILLAGGPGGRGGPWRRSDARHRFAERWAAMSPEERERFRRDGFRRCGPRFGDEREMNASHEAAPRVDRGSRRRRACCVREAVRARRERSGVVDHLRSTTPFSSDASGGCRIASASPPFRTSCPRGQSPLRLHDIDEQAAAAVVGGPREHAPAGARHRDRSEQGRRRTWKREMTREIPR